MICTPNTGHLVWGYFYALDLLSQVKKLAQHSNSIFAICNSQLLPTNQKCGLLSYPKKTKNPNPSPIGNRFGFFLFGGRGWIRTTILSACPFLPCQKMQHSSHFSSTARNARCTAGTARTLKVGCKVGYFSGHGAYSDSTPETACAVASSRPVTAWEYQP